MEDVVDVEQPLQVEAGARVHAQVRPPIDHQMADREVDRPRPRPGVRHLAQHGVTEQQERDPQAQQHPIGGAEEEEVGQLAVGSGPPSAGERGRGSAGRPGPRRVRLPTTHLTQGFSHLTQGFVTSALFGGCFLRRTLQDPKGLAHKTLVLTVIGTLSWAELGRISYVRAYDFRS